MSHQIKILKYVTSNQNIKNQNMSHQSKISIDKNVILFLSFSISGSFRILEKCRMSSLFVALRGDKTQFSLQSTFQQSRTKQKTKLQENSYQKRGENFGINLFRSLKYYVSEISKQDGSAAGCDKWHSGDLACRSPATGTNF